jgi:DNA modification methylase
VEVIRILQGDCRAVLATLPDASVQCVVTSPPYFALRSYLPDGHPDKSREVGTEQTPDAYVAEMVDVFREVRRVLADTGVVWLNLGDSYAGSWGARGRSDGTNAPRPDLEARHGTECPARNGFGSLGIKPKDRMMIPARTAIALQADGWWLRDEVVWHKPRPTPNPVMDRTVNAHEMVYLLTKRAHYFFDWEAIEEPSAYPGLVRSAGKAFRDLKDADPNAARKRPGVDRQITVRETRRARSVWSISPSPYSNGHFATMPPDLAERCIKAGTKPGDTVLDPFAGAGTTLLVADRLGRNGIGIELNPAYAAMARARITGDAPLFAEVAD